MGKKKKRKSTKKSLKERLSCYDAPDDPLGTALQTSLLLSRMVIRRKGDR